MRVHFSSIATIVVALLFVSGTVGCRSNGGDWYNPNTYSWVNPFDRSGQTAPRSSDAFANARPSLGAHPDISVPPGGYSDAPSFAGRSGAMGGHSPEPWGQPNPMGSQTPPNHLVGGFTVAEPSHLPSYMHSQGHVMDGQSFGSHHNHIASAPHQHVHQQQVPHQVQPQNMGQQHMGHQQHHMGHHIGQQQPPTPFGHSDYMQTGLHQPFQSNVHQQPAQHHIPAGAHVNHHGNHAPFGAMPQNDPHGAMQQSVTVPPSGFGFEQHPPMHHAPQQGFPGEGGLPQQQHHQPPPAGGFPPPASGGFNHW